MRWHKPESDNRGMAVILDREVREHLGGFGYIPRVVIHSYREKGGVVEVNIEYTDQWGDTMFKRVALDGFS